MACFRELSIDNIGVKIGNLKVKPSESLGFWDLSIVWSSKYTRTESRRERERERNTYSVWSLKKR
jgi:hypothetical protein